MAQLYLNGHILKFLAAAQDLEYSDLGRQGKNLILRLTAAILLDDFKRRESLNIKQKKTRKQDSRVKFSVLLQAVIHMLLPVFSLYYIFEVKS